MKRLILFTILTVFSIAVLATAQEDRGRISGIVADPTGAVIPQATITLQNEATNVTVTTFSNSAGLYTFPLLVPGLYTVQAKANGFHEYTIKGLRVEVAGNVKTDIKLNIGQATESVTVSATNVNSLKTDDAVLGTTIESRSFNDLPELFGNSFTLQLLAPGVTSTSLTADYNHTYEAGSESASVNGSQSGRTEFTLDGAPDTLLELIGGQVIQELGEDGLSGIHPSFSAIHAPCAYAALALASAPGNSNRKTRVIFYHTYYVMVTEECPNLAGHQCLEI